MRMDHRLDSEDDLPDLCVRFHVAMSVDDVTQGKVRLMMGLKPRFEIWSNTYFLAAANSAGK